MALAYVGLGSNLGSREAYLRAAVACLHGLPGCRVEAVSPIYETAPVGPPQPHFLNAVAAVRYETRPESLLAGMLEIERRFGRRRQERWGPRVLDLDLLWSDTHVVQEPHLQLPHPRLTERAFVLAPLLDVAPGLRGRYGAALAACGGSPGPARPFRPTPDHELLGEGMFEVRARDRADAWAAALQVALAPIGAGNDGWLSAPPHWELRFLKPPPGASTTTRHELLGQSIRESLQSLWEAALGEVRSGFRVRDVLVDFAPPGAPRVGLWGWRAEVGSQALAEAGQRAIVTSSVAIGESDARMLSVEELSTDRDDPQYKLRGRLRGRGSRIGVTSATAASSSVGVVEER